MGKKGHGSWDTEKGGQMGKMKIERKRKVLVRSIISGATERNSPKPTKGPNASMARETVRSWTG